MFLMRVFFVFQISRHHAICYNLTNEEYVKILKTFLLEKIPYALYSFHSSAFYRWSSNSCILAQIRFHITLIDYRFFPAGIATYPMQGNVMSL